VSDYFTRVAFQNFGPIIKGAVGLTRLHGLIGPNDSGKSCTLRGLRLAASLGLGRNTAADDELKRIPFAITATRGEYTVIQRLLRPADEAWEYLHEGQVVPSLPAPIRNAWRGSRTLRLDPDAMRQGTMLLSDSAPLEFADERGLGLGSLLDAIFARNVNDYLALENSLRELFPSVAGFRLFTGEQGRQIGVRLLDGTEVRPQHLSEGMLYFLAFSVLPLLRPVSLVLIEEPENGLHPARISEVMRVLRKMSETTQVVLATHSPLVINELRPEEVTLVTRTAEEGTRYTPIAETPNFEMRAETYALGELWLNYADGNTEEPLTRSSGAIP
jgi:energy-coupling factor transporter ATP-binding protein EcfA2